jgi:hypothetical protein
MSTQNHRLVRIGSIGAYQALGLVLGGLFGIVVGNMIIFAGGGMIIGLAVGLALEKKRLAS